MNLRLSLYYSKSSGFLIFVQYRYLAKASLDGGIVTGDFRPSISIRYQMPVRLSSNFLPLNAYRFTIFLNEQ